MDGCLSFDTLFQTFGHVSETINDIAIAPNGDMYIGLAGWFPNAGGLFKSSDNGETWEYIGLQGYQIKNLEINSQGDVFIGARDMGTYAIYHDNPEEIILLHEAVNEGLVLNSVGHIYAGTEWPNGIMRSTDNGTSFSYINSGLPLGAMGNLTVDTNDFIYALTYVSSHLLYKTYNSTVTAFSDNEAVDNKILTLYPNPATDMLFCKIEAENSSVVSHILILNLRKEIIYESDIFINSGLFKLNIDFLATGFYSIMLNTQKISYTAQFVKL